MAQSSYIPEKRSYKDNQIILSSGRVLIHSKDDSTLIFGKKSIALSSLGTVNFDVSNRVIINSPKIELGYEAETIGQPILLGNSTVQLLNRMIKMLGALSVALGQISETELETSIPGIVKASTVIQKEFPQLAAIANQSGALLSQVTYTR